MRGLTDWWRAINARPTSRRGFAICATLDLCFWCGIVPFRWFPDVRDWSTPHQLVFWASLLLWLLRDSLKWEAWLAGRDWPPGDDL